MDPAAYCCDVDCTTEGGSEEDCEKIEKIAAAMKTILECLGEDATREGLLDTPVRAAKALSYFCSGYKKTVDDVVGSGVFNETTSTNMIVVKNIDVYSLCEHHLVPFIGKVHIAYIPRDRILGLSKLARIADVYARRLQVQERLTSEIADAIMSCVDAQGVAVLIDSKHLCMAMRGVEKNDASTVTTCFRGNFSSDPSLRSEFLASLSLAKS